MDTDFLAKQTEMYSNAIVAYLTLQGTAYLFYYGTNPFFNCLVKMTPYLAEGIIVTIVIISILASVATRYLGKVLKGISPGNETIIHNIYMAKITVIYIFSTIQIFLTFTTAVLSESNLTCS